MMLSKTLSNTSGRCMEGLSAACGAAGAGAARVVPPASPPWWAVKGRPWEAAHGAQHRADHGSWAAFGLCGSMLAGGGSRPVMWGHHLMQQRGWRQQWEGWDDAKELCYESMKPSDVVFLNQDSFHSVHTPACGGRSGRDVFPSLQTHVSHLEPFNTAGNSVWNTNTSGRETGNPLCTWMPPKIFVFFLMVTKLKKNVLKTRLRETSAGITQHC